MTITNPSDRWDKKERKMDEADMATVDDPEKEKVDVVTEEKEEYPFSGLFCVYCHGLSTYIYEGMSLCNKCFAEETADLIKKNKNK